MIFCLVLFRIFQIKKKKNEHALLLLWKKVLKKNQAPVKENQADVLLSKAASLGSLWHHLPQEGRAQSYLGWGDSCPSLLLCGCFPFMRVCLLCNTPVLMLWKWPRSMEAWLRRLTARETQGVEPSCSKPRVWEQLLTSVAAVPRYT